jgi:hypothetical protein
MKKQQIRLTDHFSPRRLFLLAKRDLLAHYRTLLIASVAVAGFVILASVVSALNRGGESFHLRMYFILLYLGGFIFTSRAFRETYDAQRSCTYMTLPGSPMEKFIERALLTSLGYVLGALGIYVLIALVSEGLNRVLIGYTHVLLNPASRAYLIGAAVYMVIQGIFLAGASFFKKNAFIKTILMVTVLFILLLIVTIITARIIAPMYFEGDNQVQVQIRSLRELAIMLGTSEDGLLSAGKAIWLVLRIIFWAVLAPFCWVISFLKFRKIEV